MNDVMNPGFRIRRGITFAKSSAAKNPSNHVGCDINVKGPRLTGEGEV